MFINGVDLFAGAGGLTLGLKLAGVQIVVAIESSSPAAATYEKNNPEITLIKADIRNVKASLIREELLRKGIRRLDLVVGGPPCEAYSKANRKRPGNSHPKYRLLMEFIRFIKELKPRCFVLENVRSIRKYEIFYEALTELDGVGYEVEVLEISASDFGVPQRRKRLIVIGTKDGFSIRNELDRFKVSRQVSVREAIGDLPYIPNGWIELVMNYSEEPWSPYQKWARKGARRLYNHITMNLRRGLLKARYIRPGENLARAISRMPKSIREGIRETSIMHSNIYRRLSWDETAPTIVNPAKALFLHPEQDRIISVREAARLQSFPDTYIFHGGLASQYKQVANATPPLLARAVGRALIHSLLQYQS